MANTLYKVNEPIKIDYQASGAALTCVVNMTIFNETDAIDTVQTGVMSIVSNSFCYTKTIIPNTVGNWRIEVNDDKGGKKPMAFSVGEHNVNSIGAGIILVQGALVNVGTQLNTIESKIDDLEAPPNIA